ncbi:Na(+)-translocating NADH-quinone reductase subunit C [Candidatus Endobugula sertula]|uniref:Na(+)-translocating NADH-quinone reductase subunit C n=1 Tax=Candidatus Endobugula sertula TaxID=62101 RepID=A0A1D2QSQ6_9GAMM|nr:Na(+)-translocating NADH-quinone reductase subunit C [Candidatus Endobugula sertula]
MSSNDSIQKIFTVAFLLCIVCSIIVSTAAVMLKPAQIENKSRDFKINILKAGGLYKEGESINEQFSRITTKLVDLESGHYTDAVDVNTYDQRKASKDPRLSDPLSSADDIAKISNREKYAKVYLVQEGDNVKKVILPIKGYGLWSTLYGFISLNADLNTVSGLTFYEHGETPGLGGEVDNPNWKKLWSGKKVYTDDTVALTVIKGKVSSTTPNPEYKIDGLSGATLTTRGVDNLVKFWMGNMGYSKFLNNLKRGEA